MFWNTDLWSGESSEFYANATKRQSCVERRAATPVNRVYCRNSIIINYNIILYILGFTEQIFGAVLFNHHKAMWTLKYNLNRTKDSIFVNLVCLWKKSIFILTLRAFYCYKYQICSQDELDTKYTYLFDSIILMNILFLRRKLHVTIYLIKISFVLDRTHIIIESIVEICARRVKPFYFVHNLIQIWPRAWLLILYYIALNTTAADPQRAQRPVYPTYWEPLFKNTMIGRAAPI